MLRRDKLTTGTWLWLQNQYQHDEERVLTLSAREAFRALYCEDLLRRWDDYEAIRRGAPAAAFPRCRQPFSDASTAAFMKAFIDVYPEDYRGWMGAYRVWAEVEAAEDPQGRVPTQVRWSRITTTVPLWRENNSVLPVTAAIMAIPVHSDHHRALQMLEQRADHFPDREIHDGREYQVFQFYNQDVAEALLTRLIFWGYEVIQC